MAEKVTIDQVRQRLVDAAKVGATITYTDLYGDRWQARARSSRELGDIAMAEHKQGRPLLSVVAVSSTTGRPSDGLWKLAKQHDAGDWCDCGVPVIEPDEDEHHFVARQAQLIDVEWHVSDPLGKPYKPMGAPPKRVREPLLFKNLDALDKGSAKHEEVVTALVAFLKEHDIVGHNPSDSSIKYDLGWRHAGSLWVAEVKSMTKDSEQQQIRLGLGQVLDYRYSLQRTGESVRAVLAVETQPVNPKWVKVCDAVRVLLVWPGDRFEEIAGRRVALR